MAPTSAAYHLAAKRPEIGFANTAMRANPKLATWTDKPVRARNHDFDCLFNLNVCVSRPNKGNHLPSVKIAACGHTPQERWWSKWGPCRLWGMLRTADSVRYLLAARCPSMAGSAERMPRYSATRECAAASVPPHPCAQKPDNTSCCQLPASPRW